MSVVLASAAASVYAAAMIGFHRWNVRRLRRVADLRCLQQLDWSALYDGLWPQGDAPGPSEARRALLLSLQTVVSPSPADVDAQAAALGFTGGERRWLALLALAKTRPMEALAALEAARAATAGEAYLREFLRLTAGTHRVNLELNSFFARRRLVSAIDRFGDVPALYFVRALASANVGMNRAALDDLGRAVYYSRQAPFYVQAVLQTPWIAEARPALVYQCRQSRPG